MSFGVVSLNDRLMVCTSGIVCGAVDSRDGVAERGTDEGEKEERGIHLV